MKTKLITKDESNVSPGPWKFIIDRDDDCDNGRISDKDGFDVCSFGNSEQYYPTDGEAPSDSDMALILASPDLLSALQSLVEIYDNDGSRLYTTETKQRALDKAKVAIDKALNA